jgi:hypothetical protein
MREVDEECWRLAGVSIHDLPDQPFRDAFESGENPVAFPRRRSTKKACGSPASPTAGRTK